MKRATSFFLLVCVSCIMCLSAQNVSGKYNEQWKKVNGLADKRLPESAMKEVNKIMEDAKRTGNFPETVKAYIHQMRFTLEVNPDKAPDIIKEFEAFAASYTKPEEKALLHSMTAELYATYYSNDQYRINVRTAIEGYIPENINEWSKNLFFDKINSEISLSLQDAGALQKMSATQFDALIEKGKDSAQFQPTLFDFLSQRGISTLQGLNNIALVKNPLMNDSCFAAAETFILYQPDKKFEQSKENQIIQLYKNLLTFRLKDNNAAALLYVDMQRLEYMKDNSDLFNSGDLYLTELEHLHNKYNTNEAVTLVLEKISDHYLTLVYSSGEEDGSFRKKAYETAQEGITRFPKGKYINNLKNIQARIKSKEITVNYPTVVKPGNTLMLNIAAQNIQNVQINVYRVNATAKEYFIFSQNRNNNKIYPKRTLIETKVIQVAADENFGKVNVKAELTAGQYGIYEFSILEKGSTNHTEQAHGTFTVSDFAFIQRSNADKANNLYVVDRVNGNTIPDVSVLTTEQQWNGKEYILKNEKQLRTDKNGLVTLTGMENYSVVCFLSKGEDKYLSSQAERYYYRNAESTEDKPQLSLFTDRALYRPGQTVYFKGIAYYNQQQKIIANASYKVDLLDANWQIVTTKTVKTNEFGSFSGEFILPESGLNGAYNLRADNFYATFFVEEYKRPTFEVKIDKPEKEVSFGQTVNFAGSVKAYAGYSIADAQLSYTVTRRTHRLYWWYSSPEATVASGAAITDKDGNFNIDFIPEKTKTNNSLLRDQFYTYTLTVNATDPKGETQLGVQTISVGDKSLFIVAKVPAIQDKQKELAIPLHTETINGKKIDSNITYTLYSLEKSDSYREKTEDLSTLKIEKTILNGTFNTANNTSLKINTTNLPSGHYKIVFSTQDAQAKEVKSESYILLYSPDDSRPPVKAYVWIERQKTEVNPGENAYIRFGTSAENGSVLYEVMRGNQVLESRWIPFSNEIKTIEVPLKPAYGDGVNVLFTFIKDEQLFSRSIQVKRKTDVKKLTPALSSFRDKLKPGEQTEWTVTIPESAMNDKIAELMIGMYDASLDAIRPHQWMFDPSYTINIPSSREWTSKTFNQNYAGGYFEIKTNKTEGIALDQLNWFGLHISQNRYGGGRITGAIMRQKSEMIVVENDAEVEETLAGFLPAESAPVFNSDILSSPAPAEPVQIRTNFNETAFFYPQLRTDKDGNIKIAFTVPESLTRWNVQMLAHTPDLYYGQAESQVVTQKDLMVQLNMPRFVRKSDKLVLTANVINLTETDLTAQVNLELSNPATGAIIKIKAAQAKTVRLAAKETKPVSWEITEFAAYDLVAVKVTAHAGTFSDGEQHYLPVLPDKILVTESMPMTVRGNEKKNFHFENLLNQGKKVDNKSLSVEFTANPTWYAIQALPTLSSPANENAIDYFAAYYVNGLATHIANANPKISKVFDQWKKAGGTRETLLSNLEKNTELKNMLLEETPWVMAAKDETEQKRQIALLFDLNQQKNQSQQYLDKLLKLQKSSGGFSWFEGMSESRYITQQILLETAHFRKMTGDNTDLPAWIVKAIEYIDLEIARDFDNLKKSNKDYKNTMVIGDMQWFYLHTRSEYVNTPVHTSAQEAVNFYTAQAEKYWTKGTLYGQAATALICNRNGKTTLANDILNSLRENAMKTEELGMYWAGNKAGYFWNERPISVHVAMIEAFAEIAHNTSELDEMKIWLLKQKQTQSWDSPISTADAIYALVNYGSDWLSNEGQVEIKIGNQLLKTDGKEAGTGYIKETFEGAAVRPQMGNVTVTKSDAGIAWGAMYWQYFQDIELVENSGKALTVTKMLFVEKTQDNKTTMIPVEQTSIQKGDKVIVRLVVTTDRNLEYVAIKDLRASCFEPVDQRSGMVWREGVAYYETIKDASTQFFFNFLPTGTYVLEYEVWANNTGDFASGSASIQCQYAPEFIGNSAGSRVTVE